MGRKIPARKHMGVRDPIKQNEQRLALIKDKINNPPEKRDHQKVSHSLARFIKLKEEAATESTARGKNRKNTKRTKKAMDNEDKPENHKKNAKNKNQQTRNDKEFADITQRPDETDQGYLRRINRITHESVEEAKFEAKYGVEVIRDKKTGEIKLKKRPRNEIDEQLKQNMENQKHAKKGRQPVTPAVVISSEEKKKMVKAMLAEKKAAKVDNKSIDEFKRDEFKFGDVVHAPPQLTTPRLGKKAETVPRPGKKTLLLHSLLQEHSTTNDSNDENKKINSVKHIKSDRSKTIGSLKGKRKDLSMAMRHMIETEQTNIVKMYKEMKKNQRKESAVKDV